MKKLIIGLFAVLMCLFGAWTESNIDMSLTIKTLAHCVREGQPLPERGTPVIINGTVVSRSYKSGSGETFEGELILASGEWDASGDIYMSRCLVHLSGEDFDGTIPAKRARRKSSKEIPLNAEILVLGTFEGVAEDESEFIPLVVAEGLRYLR